MPVKKVSRILRFQVIKEAYKIYPTNLNRLDVLSDLLKGKRNFN